MHDKEIGVNHKAAHVQKKPKVAQQSLWNWITRTLESQAKEGEIEISV